MICKSTKLRDAHIYYILLNVEPNSVLQNAFLKQVIIDSCIRKGMHIAIMLPTIMTFQAKPYEIRV